MNENKQREIKEGEENPTDWFTIIVLIVILCFFTVTTLREPSVNTGTYGYILDSAFKFFWYYMQSLSLLLIPIALLGERLKTFSKWSWINFEISVIIYVVLFAKFANTNKEIEINIEIFHLMYLIPALWGFYFLFLATKYGIVKEFKRTGEKVLTLLSFLLVGVILIKLYFTPLFPFRYNIVTFEDVPEISAYYESVSLLAEKGIMSSFDESDLFEPKEKVSRKEVVKALSHLNFSIQKKRVTVYIDNSIKDVKSDAEYAKYIYWAKDMGITNVQTGEKFFPEKEIKIQDFLLMLYRYGENKVKVKEKQKKQVDNKEKLNISDKYAEVAVIWAIENDIFVVGKNTKDQSLEEELKRSLNRGDMAMYLNRFLKKVDKDLKKD